MALLILEQLDLRVDQQWINTAAIAIQRIPIGMGYHILKDLFQTVALLRNILDHISKSTGAGLVGKYWDRLFCAMGEQLFCFYEVVWDCFSESNLFSQYSVIQFSVF